MRRHSLFTLVGFAGALLGLIVMLAGWMHQNEAVTMLRNQRAANARIVALSTQIGWASYRNPTANSGSDVVIVRFNDAKGARQSAGITQYVGSGEMARLRVGEAVPIIYNPANLSDVHLKSSLLRLAKPTTIEIGIALFVLSLALLTIGLKRRQSVPANAMRHE